MNYLIPECLKPALRAAGKALSLSRAATVRLAVEVGLEDLRRIDYDVAGAVRAAVRAKSRRSGGLLQAYLEWLIPADSEARQQCTVAIVHGWLRTIEAEARENGLEKLAGELVAAGCTSQVLEIAGRLFEFRAEQIAHAGNGGEKAAEDIDLQGSEARGAEEREQGVEAGHAGNLNGTNES